jgi:hypothetical protein
MRHYLSKHFFDWPVGFLGYDSWSGWFWGDTIADRTQRERSKLRSFYEKANNPYQESQLKPLVYEDLNAFWRLWAQMAVIKPAQLRLIVAATFAFFGSPIWAEILYGKQGARQYRENVEKVRYEEALRHQRK